MNFSRMYILHLFILSALLIHRVESKWSWGDDDWSSDNQGRNRPQMKHLESGENIHNGRRNHPHRENDHHHRENDHHGANRNHGGKSDQSENDTSDQGQNSDSSGVQKPKPSNETHYSIGMYTRYSFEGVNSLAPSDAKSNFSTKNINFSL